MRGHEFGIGCLKFSPCSRYLVSLGDENDHGLLVWDWQNRENPRINSNRLTRIVHELVFIPHTTAFVTAGLEHLKYWKINEVT